MLVIITTFPFLLPNVAYVPDSGGGGPDTNHKAFPYTIDFRRRRPELSARADLGETVETAPAAHGTDSADTWTSAAPVVTLGAPSRKGQGSGNRTSGAGA